MEKNEGWWLWGTHNVTNRDLRETE